jgi:NitT/TauT family transport system ATP-binding protein
MAFGSRIFIFASALGPVGVMLELRAVSLTHQASQGAAVESLREISLSVARGQRVAVIGPSGCGKSSLLSLMAGVLAPTSGQVLWKGQAVRGPSPERGLLFQNHALFPWKTARENIEFVLRARDLPLSAAVEHLQRMGLDGFADAYPRELSGGMQQRVGLARLLAAEPELLLFDEPFAALDALTREALLEELLPRLTQALVFVTHSIDEALFVGEQVLILSPRPGVIRARLSWPGARPTRLYELKRDPRFLALEEKIYRLLRGEEMDAHVAMDSTFSI